jgi:hypothetical protein
VPAGNGIEVVAEVDKGPGNITVTPDGRILISLHQFFGTEMRVAEVMPDGSLVPFPDAWWAVGFQSRLALNSVLGIQSDARGVVWMLDNGMRDGVIPKLVGWDTQSNRLERLITLPRPVTAENSFVNDLAVDRDHDAIYIADPAGGDNAALIVVDLKTGASRRVLEGHQSVVPEDTDLVIDDRAVEIRQPDGATVRPRVGVNPIVLDHDNEWLYFGPMHGTSLYRIRTAHLRDPILDREGRLARVVERHGDKVISDGSHGPGTATSTSATWRAAPWASRTPTAATGNSSATPASPGPTHSASDPTACSTGSRINCTAARRSTPVRTRRNRRS